MVKEKAKSESVTFITSYPRENVISGATLHAVAKNTISIMFGNIHVDDENHEQVHFYLTPEDVDLLVNALLKYKSLSRIR